MTLAFPVGYGVKPMGQSVNRTSCYLLLFPKSQKTNTGNFDYFEAHSWDITLGLATTTETRDEDFVVLVDKV
jgi:hypothetical protein